MQQVVGLGTAVPRPGLYSHFSEAQKSTRCSLLRASRNLSNGSASSSYATRKEFRGNAEHGRLSRKPKNPREESYFAPPEDSDEFDSESEGYTEDEGEDDENVAALEQVERRARPKAIVKSYLENLRARLLHVKPESRVQIDKSSYNNRRQKHEVSEFSDESDVSDRESDQGTRSNPKTDEKVSARSFLEKLKARRLEKKLAENKDEGVDRRKTRSYASSDEEDKSDSIRKFKHKPNFAEERYDSSDDYVPQKTRHRRDEKELKLEDAFYSIKSFLKLGATQEIIDALASMEISRPSEIQALAFRDVVSGNTCIIADQTGSGKTLAYLAPLVQRLRKQEEQGKFSTPKNPRVLVLVPTNELAMQVLSVCRALSKSCPLKSMVATGGFKWKTQVENLENAPDIVVATPGRFLHHLEQGTMQVDKLQSIVLDEVDILFEEEEFIEAMEKVREQAPWALQYIHVTATLPTDVHDKILHLHPDSIPLMGPSLHLTAAGLNEILVDCSGDDIDKRTPEHAFENKKAALLKLVDDSEAQKTIVFCNKIETCRKVENILKRHDRSGKKLSVLPYHAAVKQETRLQSIREFLTVRRDFSTFLVCTDRASRGLDPVGVDRVILFDFPRDPSEYIRRVGRTARAGGVGKVYVFVVGKQVSLAKKVMDRNEKRHPVHAVPGHL